MRPIEVHPEVEAALATGKPVVALETAVITHGVARTPRRRPAAADAEWQDGAPANLELARLLERTVRRGGAIPATVGVVDGVLRIGMSDGTLAALAGAIDAPKASARDLAGALVARRSAGTTVAGTLAACTAAGVDRAIGVFSTGGIGGAHRGWAVTGDISADLDQLARTRLCVVCAGAKSILDLAATLEMLDSRGVPVVGCGVDALPRFLSPADPALPLPLRLDAPEAIAELCHLRWDVLAQPGAVLVAQPPPRDLALDAGELEAAQRGAEEALARTGLRGPEVTPFLLAELATRTGGRSVEANIAVLVANARLGAAISAALTGWERCPSRDPRG